MSIRYGSVTATAAALGALAIPRVASATQNLAARGESLAAFDERCIPKPPQRGCRVGGPGACVVAPPSNTPGIATPPRKPRAAGAPVLGGRALPAGRLARLGATPDFHHGRLGRAFKERLTLNQHGSVLVRARSGAGTTQC